MAAVGTAVGVGSRSCGDVRRHRRRLADHRGSVRRSVGLSDGAAATDFDAHPLCRARNDRATGHRHRSRTRRADQGAVRPRLGLGFGFYVVRLGDRGVADGVRRRRRSRRTLRCFALGECPDRDRRALGAGVHRQLPARRAHRVGLRRGRIGVPGRDGHVTAATERACRGLIVDAAGQPFVSAAGRGQRRRGHHAVDDLLSAGRGG